MVQCHICSQHTYILKVTVLKEDTGMDILVSRFCTYRMIPEANADLKRFSLFFSIYGSILIRLNAFIFHSSKFKVFP